MAEYKCICCGEIKESEKNCTCPNCGYKMYPTHKIGFSVN